MVAELFRINLLIYAHRKTNFSVGVRPAAKSHSQWALFARIREILTKKKKKKN